MLSPPLGRSLWSRTPLTPSRIWARGDSAVGLARSPNRSKQRRQSVLFDTDEGKAESKSMDYNEEDQEEA